MRALAALMTILLLLSLLLSNTVRAAEPDYGSGEFHELNLYFYGDLDDSSGSFNTTAPASDSDTESDCPQDGNRLGAPPGNSRQWEDVGSWYSPELVTNVTVRGEVPFEIWAKATSGSVKDVQFRVTLAVPGAGFLQSDTEARTVNDNATHFSTSFSLDGEFQLDRNQTIRVDLEYSGGDDFVITDPFGSQDDNQIVVLTSSYNHSAGIAMEIDHFRSEFPRIEVDHSRSVVKVETWLLSAFGNDDLQSETWELEVGGVSTGTSATVGEGILLDDDGEGLRVGWEWAYGASGAPSDTYLLTASCGDIQGNQWESTGVEKLHLVVQQHQLDNILSWEDVAVNGLVNSSSVVEGSDFTLTVLARTSGDAAINGYPLTVDVYYSFEGGEFILLEDDFAWLSPGQSEEFTFTFNFDRAGSYMLRVVLDDGDHAVETDETNNVIEYSLTVGQELEQSLTGDWLDRLREEDTLTLGIAGFAVLVILGVLMALRRSSRGDDMEWDDDDEF